MGDTSIEWTDATWNPVTGCTKVSAGCKNCYAERVFSRPYGGICKCGHKKDEHECPQSPFCCKCNCREFVQRKFTDVRMHPDRLDQPLHWKKPRKIFVNSMSDLFHEDVPFEFIDKVFAVMALFPRHTFQVLTKRPERMRDYCDSLTSKVGGIRLAAAIARELAGEQTANSIYLIDSLKRDGGTCLPLKNVWLGVSVEHQKTADERIPLLLQTPAAIRFVSYEPALSGITLHTDWTDRWFCADCATARMRSWCTFCGIEARPKAALDWVIVGGESGPGARPMHPAWARSVRDQCRAAGVAFLFKQWGEYQNGSKEWRGIAVDRLGRVAADYGDRGTYPPDLNPGDDWTAMAKVGKKAAGRILDDRTWNEFPEVRA